MPKSKPNSKPDPEPLCHCGRPLHYTDPDIRKVVQLLIDNNGEYVPVTGSDGRKWKVQRHYIALHGLKEKELPCLGFEEITDADRSETIQTD